MTDSNITCPKCGADIPLTEAVSHRLREQLEAQFEKQRAELNAALAAREKKLAEEQARIAEQQKSAEEQIAKRIEAERAKLLADAARKAEEKLGTEKKDLEHQIAELESFIGLQDQLAAEQRAFSRQWKEREAQIVKAIRHTAMIYGGVQGIAGREALPEIRTLALPGD